MKRGLVDQKTSYTEHALPPYRNHKFSTNHVLKKLKVRRGCTVPSRLTWPSTNKYDGIKEFATTDSMHGCNVLPETQFVRTGLRVDTTRVSSAAAPLTLWEPPERPEFDIKLPLGAPLLIFP